MDEFILKLGEYGMVEKKKYWLLLSIIFLLIFCIELFIPTLGDDGLFIKYPISFNWVVTRYTSWSSRTIIESILVVLSKQLWLFKLLNAAVIILLIDTLAKVTIGRRILTILTIFLLFLFLPVTLFLSAGLAATSLNYLWPVTFALYVISNLNEKISLKKRILLILLTLIAVNQEQVCAGMLAFLIYRIIKEFCVRKKISSFVLWILVINIIGVVNVLFCPGNRVRSIKSSSFIFPGFSRFSFWDKLNLGISNSGKILFYKQNFLIIAFLLLLTITTLILRDRKMYFAIPGVIVSVLVIPFNVFLSTLTVNGYNISTFNKYLLKSQRKPELSKILKLLSKLLNHNVSLFWNALFVVIIVLLLFSIYFVFKNRDIVIYFLIGLGTHIMMGFSPSIYKSGDRTLFILYIVIIYIMLLTIKEAFKLENSRTNRIQ